ncbi:MAG: tetratricopeptide repeat protein [Acidobacteria bacterium]|nr:tetratricopeptide repeat protein [Acidobacteriota bacterium]
MRNANKTGQFITLLFISFIISSCGSPEIEKLRHLTRGKEYLKEKRYPEARIEFRSALQIDKKLAEAQFGLGEAALALGYVQEAAESYYEAIRLDPNNLAARVRVGNLLTRYTNDESIIEAERLANDVLKKEPNYVEGHILMANVRIAQRQWDEAKEELQRAIELDPNRIETQLNLARYYDQRAKDGSPADQNFLAQAEAVYRQLIVKYPGAADVRLAFGDFLFAGKREAEAEQQLLDALKADPNDKMVLVALRRYYETQERYDEAEKYLARLVELDPDKSAGRAQIIDLHARTGRLTQAVTEYQQLLKDDPKYLRAYSRLAELFLELGDLNGAAKQVEAALKQNPQDTDALLIRGRLNTLSGRYREAVSDLDQAMRFEPTMPSALYYAADAHLQNNDPTQARLFVNRLLSFYPRNPMGLLMLVRIQLNESRAKEAEKTASEIIVTISQLKSNDTALLAARIPADTLPEWESKAFISRAVARIQQRDLNGAQSDLESAIKIDKKSPEPHINLATIHLLRGDPANAQLEAERAVDLAPGSVSVVSTLVNVYLRQRNYHAAHAKIDSLLNAQPNRIQLLEQKARVYTAQGDGAGAEKTLRQMIELDPNYLNAYFALSDFYQSSQKQTERSIGELREIIRLRPNNALQIAQAHMFIGLLEESRGNFDEAVRNYEQALSHDRRSVGAAIAFNNLAWLYADKGKGNLDKATDFARSAIGISPEASFFDTLGYAYYKKRQFDIAIEQFNKAIDRRPSNPIYHLHLARALRDNGDTQKARQAYERALQIGRANFAEANQARQELAALRRS